MTFLERQLAPTILRWELPITCLLAWIAFISIPLLERGIGLSWDALNHHIYLGWTAESPRFDKDFLAAGYQSYQFPYLYWPVYKLAVSGWSGAWAGVVLATLHLLAVPPIWMLARVCIPGPGFFEVSMRLLAVGMAFMTGVVLSLFDSTSNDLMAAMPLVWALALGLEPLNKNRPSWMTPKRALLLSGLLAGVAVACKLSNGPLAIVALPAMWLLTANGKVKRRVSLMATAGVATLIGFFLAYGFWGAQLWHHFGNPIYPFYDTFFASLRSMSGWLPP